MVNKCSVGNCYTNYNGHPTGTVFELKDDSLLPIWRAFLNRQDAGKLKKIFICERHFEEKFIQRNEKYPRLVKSPKPIPSIHPNIAKDTPSLLPSVPKLRKPPTQRVYQQDEWEKFKQQDTIKDFGDITEKLLKHFDHHFSFARYDDHAIFYKMEKDDLSIPTVTTCIRVDADLHVRLYHRGSPLPLPEWFRKSSCKLTSKSMLQNFPGYIEQKRHVYSDVLEELRQLQYKKSPVYSANVIRYALLLRYTSLQAYKLLQQEFKLPSVSLLRRITSGKIDTLKTAKVLRENGNISNDVILMFDEMFLQKTEEYFAGESIGADENGELFKGIVNFMIVGLKSNVPYVVKACPEREITGDWLMEELSSCLKMLQESGFNVRGVVSDDHATNVCAYKKLLLANGQSPDDLFLKLNGKKIYLFFDTVHIIKNIRNNLLNRKRFLFPSFHFDGFSDDVSVVGGEISWHLFHKLYEKDLQLDANLRAAPELSAKVLHPGNCKQSVPVALAIFNRSTSTGIKRFFPEKADAAEFLNLVDVWWTISNSKTKENSRNRLGNAAVPGDRKPQFLRAFADWIEKWDQLKLPNCEQFTLTAQTSNALRRTLRCHAALLEDLFQDGYQFVLTARFQSDPLERRFGQYRQMSGGRFLVGLKEIQCSEKILKIQSLVREGFDINESVKEKDDKLADKLACFKKSVEPILLDSDRIRLSDESKEVSDNVAGYIAKKLSDICSGCCDHMLTKSCSSADRNYVQLLSRGGLKHPSAALSNFVAHGLAMLHATSDLIRKSPLSSRLAGEEILKSCLHSEGFVCEKHEQSAYEKTIRTISNVFFNNQRKRNSETVVKDMVADFKKSKRRKSY